MTMTSGEMFLPRRDGAVEVLFDGADQRLDFERRGPSSAGSSMRVIFALKNGAVWMK